VEDAKWGMENALRAKPEERGLHHNNLWSKYASGKHLPSADTIRACEAILPSSSELLSDFEA
jgi:hypothetical protein